MRKAFFILFIIHCTLPIVNAQWVRVSGGFGNTSVTSLTSNGNYVYAGLQYNYQGIYYSTNDGTSWIQSLSYLNCYSLASNGSIVFAGTVRFPHPPYTEVLYLTTNNGTNWSESLIYRTVLSLAISGNNIYAGTENYGVYYSSNNGAGWVQTSLNNQYIYSVAVNGNNVFAGSAYNIYKSTNNGTNWNQITLNNLTVNSILINNSNIFAGTGASIYLSTDNGANWTQAGLNNQTVFSLVSYGNFIFAGTSSNGVYVSSNNGANWLQINEGLNNLVIQALCVTSNYIIAGTSGGAYRRPLSELTGNKSVSSEIPDKFSLSQNYPNPFNPTTKIRFDIPSVGQSHAFDVRLIIYDILGREVATLVNEQLSPGTYEVEWPAPSGDASAFPSGAYYYKLLAGDPSALLRMTKKMVLIK